MKRYDFRCMLTGDSKVIIEPAEYGGWCDYKEAEAELAALKAEIAKWVEDGARMAYNNAKHEIEKNDLRAIIADLEKENSVSARQLLEKENRIVCLHEGITELKARIAELEKPAKWVPKKGQVCMVRDADNKTWQPDEFIHMDDDIGKIYFRCVRAGWRQCRPLTAEEKGE